MEGSSSCPSDFLEDSVKEHKAHYRKCEETLVKLLKEGKDTEDFAIERKGKGEIWKRKM